MCLDDPADGLGREDALVQFKDGGEEGQLDIDLFGAACAHLPEDVQGGGLCFFVIVEILFLGSHGWRSVGKLMAVKRITCLFYQFPDGTVLSHVPAVLAAGRRRRINALPSIQFGLMPQHRDRYRYRNRGSDRFSWENFPN